MKLFTIGPVQMYPSTASVRAKGFPHFRTLEFGNIVKNNLGKLGEFLGTSAENGIIYLSASGTGAMEAVVENCTNAADKALVINGGSFGHRFVELLKYHNIPCDSVDLKWNETLTAGHLRPFENKGYTTLFVNLHETSTGQLYDIEMLAGFAKRNNMMFIVDAISTFLADEYNMQKHGIDATIISSQKGLCLSPGMAIVAFSRRMIDKINAAEKTPSKYFDFKDYLVNIPRGQTPYTPPVCVMFELQDMLAMIEKEGGLQARLKSVAQKAAYFRKKALSAGYTIPPFPLSNLLTPLYFEDIDAEEVIHRLADEYKIYVNPCGGELAHRLFRVSHIGNTDLADIDDLLEKLNAVIKEVKNG